MEQITKAMQLPGNFSYGISVWILIGIRFDAIRVSKSSSPDLPGAQRNRRS